jgi:hypothetical protein
MKNRLRQGQTIWVIRNAFLWSPAGKAPHIDPVFLHSQKVKLPPPGTVIEKMPVHYAQILEMDGFEIYRTRRKAQRALKGLIK